MTPWWLGVLGMAVLPLVPLILAKGFRADRFSFAVYLGVMVAAGLAGLIWPVQRGLRWRLALVLCGLPIINGFMCFESRGWADKGLSGKLSMLLVPVSAAVAGLFLRQYQPGFLETYAFFLPQSSWAPAILLGFVASMASLSLCWERWARSGGNGSWGRLFRLGLILWWLVLLFFLSRLVFSGDRAPVVVLDLLLGVHLFWILGAYPLLLRGGFLGVRGRPSAKFVGRASQTVLVLGIVAMFLWAEALVVTWGISRAVVELAALGLLIVVLGLPLVPVGPLAAARRYLQQHLYLPERDFAQEVSFYLRAMGGKLSLQDLLDHLQECLEKSAAALYRLDRTGKLRLQARSSSTRDVPQVLEVPRAKRESGVKSEGEIWMELRADGDPVGYLLLEGAHQGGSWEKESLLRFWSATLGVLLRELEWREKEQEQRKLALYSQATSFLLHDAKNLAQLLDLILKNYNRLDPSEKERFLEAALPGLEQARVRAKRILEKLETFHPSEVMLREEVNLSKILEAWVKEVRSGFPGLELLFVSDLDRALWVGDPTALCRALENLVVNASQAIDGKGPVEIRLKSDALGYRIEVRDSGCGVPERVRGRLFEPLFTSKPGGSGLGLYQSRVLVERLGGVVGFEPNEPKGSVFYVRLDSGAHRRG